MVAVATEDPIKTALTTEDAIKRPPPRDVRTSRLLPCDASAVRDINTPERLRLAVGEKPGYVPEKAC